MSASDDRRLTVLWIVAVVGLALLVARYWPDLLSIINLWKAA